MILGALQDRRRVDRAEVGRGVRPPVATIAVGNTTDGSAITVEADREEKRWRKSIARHSSVCASMRRVLETLTEPMANS